MEKALNKTEKVLKNTDLDIPFVRKGVAGDFRNYFNDKCEKEFIRFHKKTIKKLGYID